MLDVDDLVALADQRLRRRRRGAACATTRATAACGSPCTRSTCPPTGSAGTTRRGVRRPRPSASSPRTRTCSARSPAPTTAWSRWCATSCGASRSRTSGSTSRTGTASARTPTRTPTSGSAAAGLLAPRTPRTDSPGRYGIRFKSLEAPTRRRGIRPSRCVLDGARARPATTSFVVTLPKVTSVAQVEALVAVLERLEKQVSATSRAQRFEIQVETPQTDPRTGRHRAGGPDDPRAAGDGCTGLHYGTYDYSAFLRHRGRATRAWSTPRPTTPRR